MKKIAIITSAALLLTAAVSAQTDTVPKQNTEPTQQPANDQQQPEQQPVATKTYNDKYNNWSADTYKMLPMPEALTVEKIFPVIGQYEIKNEEGATSTLNITLDETNKGIVWIDGLPQGRIKATLRKSPATYKIPVQPLEAQELTEEAEVKTAKNAKTAKAKELPEGVLIYDRDANVINLCLGCKYNNEDPATAFTPAAQDTEATGEEAAADKKTKSKKTTKTTKVEKTKPVHYTGSKVIQEMPATEDPAMQQEPQQQQ